MKTLLITGGTGFIGRMLTQRALAAGYRVRVLSRDPDKARRQLPGISAFSDIGQAFAEPADVLVNLAGESLFARWTEARKKAFYDSRIGLTRQLVASAERHGRWPDTVISGSAVGFYGPDNGDARLTESSPGVDSFSHQLCHAWEQAASDFAREGSRLVLLRTGIVLDKEGGALRTMLLPFRLGLAGRIGSGRQWMSWISRTDHVSLMLYAMEHEQLEGPLNATAPEPVTNREFTQTLARQLRRPALIPLPAPVVRGVLGEMGDELLLASQRVVPAKALESGFRFEHPTLTQALRTALAD